MGSGIEFQMYGADTLKARLPMMFLWVVEQGGICLMTSANVEEHREKGVISDRRFAG